MERGPRLDRRGPEGRLPYSSRDDNRAQGEADKADPAQGEPGERDGEQWESLREVSVYEEGGGTHSIGVGDATRISFRAEWPRARGRAQLGCSA